MKTEKEINDAVDKLWNKDPKASNEHIVTIRETLEWVLGDTTIVDEVILEESE